MSFKRPLSVSPPLQQLDGETTERETTISSESNLCRICGDEARIINYGTLSCQSCRTFFRRNGFRLELGRPCEFNGSCEVNVKTRRTCTACRLAKCLLMGMSPELIRKEDRKVTKFKITEPIVPEQQISVLQLSIELMGTDRLSLSPSDWTLISNIVHAHDTFCVIPKMRRIVEEVSASSIETRFDMENALETIRSMFTTMQSFVTSTPDFQILTLNEQRSLFERNLYGVAGLYSILVLRDSGMIDSAKCWEPFTTIYGCELPVNTKRMSEQLDLDSNIIKIMLIVFAFSSNYLVAHTYENMQQDSLLFGTHRLLGSQYAFVELLWKYMICRYSFYDSVHRFTRLITLLLNLMKCSAVNYTNNATHRGLVDDAVEKTKEVLIIRQNEQISVWAKNMTDR